MIRRISDSTIRRLSHYLRALDAMKCDGLDTVSSEDLAARGGTSAAQVRKDLSHFGSFGKRGLGYAVAELSNHLRGILGLHRRWRVVLVGAGRIGSALYESPSFARQGFDFVAVLDDDPLKVGRPWGGLTIRPSSDLEDLIRTLDVELVVLAVPPEAVQGLADRAVGAGALGILNFAPRQLRVPQHVALRDVNLVMDLEALSFAITQHGNGE